MRVSGNAARTSVHARVGKSGARRNDDHRARRAPLRLSRQARCRCAADLIGMADTALSALQDRIRAAVAAKQALVIRGGGSKAFYGEPCPGEALDTTALTGIVAYAS